MKKLYCNRHLPLDVATLGTREHGDCATCGRYGYNRIVAYPNNATDDDSASDASPLDIVEAAVVAETVVEALTDTTDDSTTSDESPANDLASGGGDFGGGGASGNY